MPLLGTSINLAMQGLAQQGQPWLAAAIGGIFAATLLLMLLSLWLRSVTDRQADQAYRREYRHRWKLAVWEAKRCNMKLGRSRRLPVRTMDEPKQPG